MITEDQLVEGYSIDVDDLEKDISSMLRILDSFEGAYSYKGSNKNLPENFYGNLNEYIEEYKKNKLDKEANDNIDPVKELEESIKNIDLLLDTSIDFDLKEKLLKLKKQIAVKLNLVMLKKQKELNLHNLYQNVQENMIDKKNSFTELGSKIKFFQGKGLEIDDSNIFSINDDKETVINENWIKSLDKTSIEDTLFREFGGEEYTEKNAKESADKIIRFLEELFEDFKNKYDIWQKSEVRLEENTKYFKDNIYENLSKFPFIIISAENGLIELEKDRKIYKKQKEGEYNTIEQIAYTVNSVDDLFGI